MEHNTKLSSSEVANLWSSYMSDSMNICVMTYFLAVVEDPEIEEILAYSKALSEGHLTTISSIFKEEGIPLPQGFTKADVVESAPRLYSDIFYLRYLESMGRNGANINGMALGTSYRKDIKAYYRNNLNETGELYDRVTDLMAEKGILSRTPYISYPDKVEFIEDESFMAGYLTFKKRPLLAIEIIHISNNIEANLIGRTLILGLAQVAENKEVIEQCQKGMKLARKIVSSFSELLAEDQVTPPSSWDADVTNSTVSPFSDKLIIELISSLNAMSLSNLGQGFAASMRSDIAITYTNFSAQVAKYASSCVKLSIKNRWLEKPPQMVDFKALQEKGKQG